MNGSIRFFGVAGYEIVTSAGQHILMDPYLDDNPGCPIGSAELQRVDLITVSHATFDHLGDTAAIARRTGAPVVCGGDVKAILLGQGIPEEQIRAAIWGIGVEVAGIKVQPVECHHWSPQWLDDGSYIGGTPLSFIVYAEPGLRFYHYGDTSLFSDLQLIGKLYQPNIGCIGITMPVEINDITPAAGKIISGEMTPREGLLAAQWLGLDTVLPCHYINPDCEDVGEFLRLLEQARANGEPCPARVEVLAPGAEIVISGHEAGK